jgi:hypothetical protein
MLLKFITSHIMLTPKMQRMVKGPLTVKKKKKKKRQQKNSFASCLCNCERIIWLNFKSNSSNLKMFYKKFHYHQP